MSHRSGSGYAIPSSNQQVVQQSRTHVYPDRVRNLRLMADYECWPLWESGAAAYNVDPASIPLSDHLRKQLCRWAERYDDTLDRDIPQNSGFPSEAEAQEWINNGRRLAELLRHELPAQHWSITYFHDTDVAIAHVALGHSNGLRTRTQDPQDSA